MYKDMNQFWGRLEDTAEVESLSQYVLAQTARERFKDPSSIEAAQEVTKEIRDAADEYLNVLARQGMEIPATAVSTTFASLQQTGPTDLRRLDIPQLDALWHHEVDKGIQLLIGDDHPGYICQLRNAHAIWGMEMIQWDFSFNSKSFGIYF
jgi:hypothetical protein